MANIVYRGAAAPTVANTAANKNAALTNDEIDKNFYALNVGPTIGTTTISPGTASTTLAGLTSVTSASFSGPLTGNASTATTLTTARTINGSSFDGSANITVTAAAGTLTGGTLASGVTLSSLTKLGTGAGLVKSDASGNLTVDTTAYLSGTVAIANGGTNITTYATGDILYASATNTLAKLAKGSDGQVLKLVSGFPAWGADVDTNTTYSNGTGLGLTGTVFSVNYGTTATTACVGNDARLSDSRVHNGTALSATTGAFSDTIIVQGITVGKGNLGGASSTAVGNGALAAQLATGFSNTAVGRSALNSATTGSYNTSVGDLASQYLTIGTNNVAVGHSAMRGKAIGTPITGSGNIAIGQESNALRISGDNNISLGRRALYYNETGSNNTAIGYLALWGTATADHSGSGNVALGAYAGVYENGSNTFYIDNQDRGDVSTAQTNALMYGQFNSVVASQILNINAGLTVTGYISSSGNITASGTITSSSDARIKTNVTKIDRALAKVEQLNGYTFDRTDVETPRQTGVIAQEVLKVLPEAVSGTEDTTYTVAYGNMIGLMIEAIKELNAKVADLQNQLNK